MDLPGSTFVLAIHRIWPRRSYLLNSDPAMQARMRGAARTDFEAQYTADSTIVHSWLFTIAPLAGCPQRSQSATGRGNQVILQDTWL